MVINCLESCDALCCRKQKGIRLVFDLTQTEVRRLRKFGAKLTHTTVAGGGYEMDWECVGLDGIKCRWHGTSQQPGCCRDNQAGGELCLRIRDNVLRGRRYSEVELREIFDRIEGTLGP